MKKAETSFSKRLLAGLLAMLMIVCLLPLRSAPAYADDEQGDNQEVQQEPVALAVALTQANFTYDPNGHSLSAYVTNEGLSASDYSLSYELGGVATASPSVTEVGEYSLTVYATSNKEGYTSSSTSFTITVSKATVALQFTATPGDAVTADKDSTLSTVYQLANAEGLTLSYSSSNEAVATIDGSGVVTVKGFGATTITASAEDSEHYTYTPATHTLTINAPAINGVSATYYSGIYDGAEHDAVTVTLPEGEGYTVSYSLNGGEWSNSCKVTNAGTYSAQVKVSKDGFADTALSGTATINKLQAQIDISGSAMITKVEAGESAYYQAFIRPDTDGNYPTTKTIAAAAVNTTTFLNGGEISGDDRANATYQIIEDGIGDSTVTDGGDLTVKQAGTVVLRATIADTSNVQGTSMTYTIKVGVRTNQPSQLVSFESTGLACTLSDTLPTVAAVKTLDNDSGTISYALDEVGQLYLAVDENGQLSYTNFAALYTALDNSDEAMNVVVTATKAAVAEDGFTYYCEDTASYTLSISLAAAPTLTLDPADPVEGSDGWYKDDVSVSADGYTLTQTPKDALSFTAADFEDTLSCTQSVDARIVAKTAEGGYTKSQPLNLKIDNEGPQDVSLSFETVNADSQILDIITFSIFDGWEKTPFVISKDDVLLVLTAKDKDSGVDKFTLNYSEGENSLNNRGAVLDAVSATDAESGETYYTAQVRILEPQLFGFDPAKENPAENLQARGVFTMTATDRVGHVSDPVSAVRNISIDPENPEEKGVVFVYDSISPELTIAYSGEGVGTNFSGAVTVTITAREANFDLGLDENKIAKDLAVSLTNSTGAVKVLQNGAEVALNALVWTPGEEQSTCSFVVAADQESHANDGAYTLTVNYTDAAGNAADPYSGSFVVDTTPPTVTAIFNGDTENPDTPADYYNQTVSAIEVVFTVTDWHFEDNHQDAFEGLVSVQRKPSAKDPAAPVTGCSFSAWSTDEVDPSKHSVTLTIPVDTAEHTDDGIYSVSIGSFADAYNNASSMYSYDDFTVDTIAPAVEVSTNAEVKSFVEWLKKIIFFFVPSDDNSVSFHVVVTDALAGIQSIHWEYKGDTSTQSGDIEIKANEIYEKPFDLPLGITNPDVKALTITAVDKAGNSTDQSSYNADGNTGGNTGDEIVVDNTAPQVEIAFNGEPIDNAEGNVNHFKSGENVSISFTVTEAYFNYGLNAQSINKDFKAELKRTFAGEETVTTIDDLRWTQKPGQVGVYTATYPITDDGDYELVSVTYKDLSKNDANINPYDGKFTVDQTVPTVTATFNGNNSPVKYYNQTVSTINVVLTVTDWHFEEAQQDAFETAVSIQRKVNATANLVDVTTHSFSAWSTDEVDPSIHTVTMTIPIDTTTHADDGIYSVSIEPFEDAYKNASVKYIYDDFTVDTTPPVVLVVHTGPESYNTFGDYHYYKASSEALGRGITITIEELNFKAADVVGQCKEDKKGAVTNLNSLKWSDELEHVATFALGDGWYTFTLGYTDLAGNAAVTANGNALVSNGVGAYDEKLVVDGTKPTGKFTATVEVATPGLKAVLSGILHFFQNKADIHISVADATAGIHQVRWWYEREQGASTLNNASSDGTINANGETSFTSTVTLSGNYRGKVTIQAVDRSGNEQEPQYFWLENGVLNEIVVDSIGPAGTVGYNEPINLIDGISYYGGKDKYPITGTINMTEANFFGEDVDVTLNGAPLPTTWADKNATEHTGNFMITQEGSNHIVKVNYTDRSGNGPYTYQSNQMVYDTTPPTATVGYNPPVNVIDGIAYYGGNITGTINMTEANFFGEDVDVTLNGAPLPTTWADKNATEHTGNFMITQDGENYIVEISYTDRSGNGPYVYKSPTPMVIDTIAPEGDVTYNASVGTVNGVTYFDEAITGTISITERNFFSEDVEVTLNGEPLPVNWTDQGGDQHTGVFSITEDGKNYVVEISYTDRSGNGPFTYRSEPMTIDTVDPVIELTGIENESANNDETIGFTISATDQNVETSAFSVQLTKMVKEDSGDGQTRYRYVTENVPVGTVKVETDNDGATVLSFTVEDLPDDGVYFLTAVIIDNAGHEVTAIKTASGETSDEIRFSVNREGSVFWVETEHNDKYSDQVFENLLGDKDHYYANDHVKVVVHEVNVDRVDTATEQRSKTSFTLNDGSSSTEVDLVENENYDKNQQVGKGGWYETTYTLDDSNFDHDGVYSFNLVTYDSAGNGNVNSKQESGMLSFVLDRTPPAITANVRSGQRINDTAYTVEFKIAELNLEEDSVKAQLLDNRGSELRAEMSSLGNNEYVLPIGTGLEMSLVIDARDLAGNPAETLNVERLTVSDNFLVLWYANKPLFWGSIGGVLLLATGTVWSVIGRRKKNKETV